MQLNIGTCIYVNILFAGQFAGSGAIRQPWGIGPPHSTEALKTTKIHGLLDIPLHPGRGEVPLGRAQLRGGAGGGGARGVHPLHRALERPHRPVVPRHAGQCPAVLMTELRTTMMSQLPHSGRHRQLW